MQKYITFGWNALIKELWVQPKNRQFNKPDGGAWACKYTPDKEYISSWQEWCNEENFTTGRMDIGVVFNLSDNARIYTINKYEDLEWLMERYKDKDSYPTIPTFDFEKLSMDYDVIELTDEGQWATRLSHPLSLYGWDVECILVLNFDVIGEQEGIEIK
jgi:hypothetical protein